MVLDPQVSSHVAFPYEKCMCSFPTGQCWLARQCIHGTVISSTIQVRAMLVGVVTTWQCLCSSAGHSKLQTLLAA